MPSTIELPRPVTGFQLISSLIAHRPFSTGHAQLDHLLSARPTKRCPPPACGVSRQQQIQIQGPPGVGKTKLALGLAVRARATSLAPAGLDGEVEVLLVDAEGALTPALVLRAVRALVEAEHSGHGPTDPVHRIAAGIHLVRVASTAELGFFFHRLPLWLRRHPKVKLVVLDSITAHTRYVSMSIGDRATIARIIRQGLTVASAEHDCAVVVTSQLALARSSGSKQGANLVPPDFKSNAWSTLQMWRVVLMYHHDGSRRAGVVMDQNVVQPKLSHVHFAIDAIGIFDPTAALKT